MGGILCGGRFETWVLVMDRGRAEVCVVTKEHATICLSNPRKLTQLWLPKHPKTIDLALDKEEPKKIQIAQDFTPKEELLI